MGFGFVETISAVAFSLMPPLFWALGLLILAAFIALKTRMSGSASWHLFSIFIFALSDSLGGWFTQMGSGIMVIGGVIVVLAIFRIIRR